MINYVIQYDTSIPLDELELMYQRLKTDYPDENIIFIPQNFIFKTLPLDKMIEIRNQMDEIIKKEQKK